MRRLNGFTLIELLIVVAIIGILAAIAVPNFLNARVRAKIARVQADFKSIDTSLTLYRLDNGVLPTIRYPRWMQLMQPNTSNAQLGISWIRMTTPIAYIDSQSIQDPFLSTSLYDEKRDVSVRNLYYELFMQNEKEPILDNNGPFRGFWLAASIGPDVVLGSMGDWVGNRLTSMGNQRQIDNLCTSYPLHCSVVEYNPSNGLISTGDIYRFEGGAVDPHCEYINGRKTQ